MLGAPKKAHTSGQKVGCLGLAASQAHLTGIIGTQQCLETPINDGFHDFQLDFVPRFVPRYSV
jgi:hypothetical protein